MPTNRRERRLVMQSSSHSPKYSLSLAEKPAALTHRRRSSNPQITPHTVTTLTPPLKRSPLAPLHPQADQSHRDAIMSRSDDQLLQGRKPSITLTNATRPTPYPQRTSSRRPLPPTQPRRTSMPSLYMESSSSSATSPFPDPVPMRQDDDIYSGLSTFTFGDAHAHPVASTSAHTDDIDAISPLQRLGSFDLTPRPSLSQHAPQSHTNGWSSPSEDEAEEKRRSTRAKMRAIDDGTRRPSLPSNVLGPVSENASSSSLQTNSSTDNGKGKAVASPERGKNRIRPSQNHPIGSHTDDPSYDELDTDVDLMALDAEPLISDHSSVRTFGGESSRPGTRSVYGGISESDDLDHHGDAGTLNEDSMSLRAELSWNNEGRRGSLPMDIPKSSGSSQTYARGHYPPAGPSMDMHAIAQMRRPSRSLDDDLSALSLYSRGQKRGSIHSTAGSSGMGPASEPNMRGLAIAHAQEVAAAAAAGRVMDDQQLDMSWDMHTQQTGQNESPYQGLDLDYILSGSGPSPLNSARPGSNQFMFDGRNGLSGDGLASLPREREGSWGLGIFGGLAAARRTSTGTVGTMGDDSFLRLVKKGDPRYTERHREWSFARERAEGEGTGLGGGERGGTEVWRCIWVGRYKVERAMGKSVDSKPPQSRLNVRHIPDPYSKGNTRGGPVTFVHKHSRAQAFSIFRGHALPTRHLKTNTSILLAPKKVQEQFTSTRTTAKLSTHGLLEDGTKVSRDARVRARTGLSGSAHASGSAPQRAASEREAPQHRSDPGTTNRRLERVRDNGASAVRSTPDASSSTIASTSRESNGTSQISNTPSTSQTSASSLISLRTAHTRDASDHTIGSDVPRPETATSMSSNITLSTLDYSIMSHAHATMPPHQRHAGRLPAAARTQGSITSLEDHPVMKTSHAEAFATLDPTSIEYLRAHGNNLDVTPHSSEQDSPPSRFRGLRKLFQVQPVRSSGKHGNPSTGPHSAVLEGHYTPPWLTMAARSKQEEQERAIKDFHESFTSVGLLPPSKSKKPRVKQSKRKMNENVLDQIPDDALYMLLPMWPGETDAASTNQFEDPSMYEIPLEDRQYLLVYYVPFVKKEEEKKDKDKKDKEKKRPRQSQTGSSSSHQSHHSDSGTAKDNRNTVQLTSFNILARLVSHRDVNGTGIRVPTSGLSVTGPLLEAVQAIPQIRFQVDDLTLIIGFCDKRERGVEFLPEATEKLGLSLPRVSLDPDSDVPLSPIGRAAVEMAWLGALAVMGFNSDG